MTTDMNLHVLLGTIELLALWVFIFYFWRDYRLDSFRDELFKIRDEIFIWAASSGVPFDHPAHVAIRNRLNVLVRYAHRFTLTGLIMVMINPHSHPDGMEGWKGLLDSLPSEEARERFRKVQIKVALIVLKHMITRSFLLYLLLFIPLKIAGKTMEIKKLILDVVPAVERLESEVSESEAASYSRRGRRAVAARA